MRRATDLEYIVHSFLPFLPDFRRLHLLLFSFCVSFIFVFLHWDTVEAKNRVSVTYSSSSPSSSCSFSSSNPYDLISSSSPSPPPTRTPASSSQTFFTFTLLHASSTLLLTPECLEYPASFRSFEVPRAPSHTFSPNHKSNKSNHTKDRTEFLA